MIESSALPWKRPYPSFHAPDVVFEKTLANVGCTASGRIHASTVRSVGLRAASSGTSMKSSEPSKPTDVSKLPSSAPSSPSAGSLR